MNTPPASRTLSRRWRRKLTGLEQRDILERQAYECFYCRHELRYSRAVYDHLVPKTLGGSDLPHNRVAACVPCDTAKGARPPTEEESQRLLRQRTCADEETTCGQFPPVL